LIFIFIALLIFILPALKAIFSIFIFILFGNEYVIYIDLENLNFLKSWFSFFIEKADNIQLFSLEKLGYFFNNTQFNLEIHNLWIKFIEEWKIFLDQSPEILSIDNISDSDKLLIKASDTLRNIISLLGLDILFLLSKILFSVSFIILILKNMHNVGFPKNVAFRYKSINLISYTILALSFHQWAFRIILGTNSIIKNGNLKELEWANIYVYLFLAFSFVTFISYLFNIWYSTKILASKDVEPELIRKFIGYFCIFLILSTILNAKIWEGAMFDIGIPIYNKISPHQYFLVTIGSKLGIFGCMLIIYLHKKYLYNVNDIVKHLVELYPNNKLLMKLIELMKNKKISTIIIILFCSFIIVTLLNLIIIVPIQYMYYIVEILMFFHKLFK
jgi:hypothetical protein